jgi:hypothetical protein
MSLNSDSDRLVGSFMASKACRSSARRRIPSAHIGPRDAVDLVAALKKLARYYKAA